MARYRATLFLAVVVALATAGCGSSAGPGVATASGAPGRGEAPASDTAERSRQFADCMREHGMPLSDDPNSRNGPQLVPGAEQKADAAMAACRQYMPDGGEPPRMSPEDLQKAFEYAKCMRDNGVPEYPDPDPVTGHTTFNADLGASLKKHPRMTAASEACRNLAPRPGGQAPGMGVG